MAVFTQALGTYAQRLATIARGDRCLHHLHPGPHGPAREPPGIRSADATAAYGHSDRRSSHQAPPPAVDSTVAAANAGPLIDCRSPTHRAGSVSSQSQRIDQAETIDSLGRYAFGWSDTDAAGASARRGLNEDVVRDISAKKSEPQWMLERPAQGAQALRTPADADLGCRPVRHPLRHHQVLRAVHREAGRSPGRTCPTTSRTPTTSWASRRPRSSGSSPVSPRSTSPRSSTTRSRRTSSDQGVIFLDTDSAPAASTRSSSRSTSAR